MAKTTRIDSLEIKTVPTVDGTARVVLLPGHRFSIKHFFPTNLIHEQYLGDSRRARQVRSRIDKGSRFVAKVNLSGKAFGNTWTVDSEARLAQFANRIASNVKVEQPLALIFRRSGKHEVIYRRIPRANVVVSAAEYEKILRFHKKLKEHGISPNGYSIGRDEKGRFVLMDLENWKVEPKKARELSLQKRKLI